MDSKQDKDMIIFGSDGKDLLSIHIVCLVDTIKYIIDKACLNNPKSLKEKLSESLINELKE